MHSTRHQSGIALVATLLTLTIFSLMAVGFFFLVIGNQSAIGSERDNTIAFYGAEGALENMSNQLAALFATSVSPTPSQVNALDSQPPTIQNVTFPTAGTEFPDGGYYIGYQLNGSGGLMSTSGTIGGTGPLAGLEGVITPFTLTAIAQGPNNTEVKLVRQVQEVSVPVFEFGIFSNNDLAFFAGPDFNFGGRVGTNGNLFLTEGPGATLTLSEKVTAYENVIVTQLENGWTTSDNYDGDVDIVTTPGDYLNLLSLAAPQGSLVAGPGSAANTNWPKISETDYNSNIVTSTTGAKMLNMSFAMPGSGSSPIQVIERAQSSDNSLLAQARLENQASVRILLSDLPSDLPNAPSATGYPSIVELGQPKGGTLTNPPLNSSLAAPYGTGSANSYGYTVSACDAPIAVSPGAGTTGNEDDDFVTGEYWPLITGYIEVDIQTSSGTWEGVTSDVLSHGITETAGSTTSCPSYHPILHLEELNKYPCYHGSYSASSCSTRTSGSTSPTDYVPINMYDTREGNLRDNNTGSITLNGVMNVIELDVQNLQWWFANDTYGKQALFNDGYIVYFSDRRNNFSPTSTSYNYLLGETGMYGNEDIVNPASSTGTPDGVMESAEDVDGPDANRTSWATDQFETYGATASCAYTTSPDYPCPGASPLNAAATPEAAVARPGIAEKNAVIFFRHSLRLVDGALGSLPPYTTADCSIARGSNGSGGFTVASENPVYVEGNYNAANSTFSDTSGDCHVPAAVMADAVTLLSTSWSDVDSFNSPTDPSGRVASTTYYRTAIMGGTNIPFQMFDPGTTTPLYSYSYYDDFGTDGGVHNFLRMIEDWGNSTLYYMGSLADFYYSRQATGVYKCCTTVYSPPTRAYTFDTDFENIATIPPGTPHFTDVNALGFQQDLLSSQ